MKAVVSLGALFCIVFLVLASGCIFPKYENMAIPYGPADFNGLSLPEFNAGKPPPTDKVMPSAEDLNESHAGDLNRLQIDENKGTTVERKPQIDLRINTQKFYPYEGESFIVPGRFRYSDEKFIVQFDRVIKRGFNQYEARFNLYDLNWGLINYTVIPEQQEVEFYDKDGNLIQLGAFIYFAYVMMPPS